MNLTPFISVWVICVSVYNNFALWTTCSWKSKQEREYVCLHILFYVRANCGCVHVCCLLADAHTHADSLIRTGVLLSVKGGSRSIWAEPCVTVCNSLRVISSKLRPNNSWRMWLLGLPSRWLYIFSINTLSACLPVFFLLFVLKTQKCTFPELDGTFSSTYLIKVKNNPIICHPCIFCYFNVNTSN